MKAISKEKENAEIKAKEHGSKVQRLKDQLLQLQDGTRLLILVAVCLYFGWHVTDRILSCCSSKGNRARDC